MEMKGNSKSQTLTRKTKNEENNGMPDNENRLVKYKDTRYKSLPVAKDDLQEVMNLSVQGLRNYRSCHPIYADNEQGLQALLERSQKYFEYIAQTNASEEEGKRLIPNVEGLCVFLGISRVTFMKYERRSEQWHEAIQYIKTMISNAKLQLAQRFKIPPVVLFFDLINNSGYQNTNAIKVEAEPVPDKGQSNAELLESLKGAVVIEEADTAEDTKGNGLLTVLESDPDDGGGF